MQKNDSSKDSLHNQITDSNKSVIQRYQELALGTQSWWYLVKFELIMLFCSWVPGALGLVLRKFLYPRILGSVGRNVVFGRGVSIVHGSKVALGDNVIVGDYVVLDAKGNTNSGISIGSDTILSRNTVISCKNGNIAIGSDCSIGINTLVHSIEGSNVSIDKDVVIGAFCYFIGGGTYQSNDLDMPFKKQGSVAKGGVQVANNVWFGSNVQILDGVNIGTGSIIGTSTVVNKSVDDYWVVAGVPMKKLRSRKEK